MFGNFMSFFMHKHTVNLTEHAMYLDTVILGACYCNWVHTFICF